MNEFWDPVPPSFSELGDHDVPIISKYLAGKRIALLICGGIAAMKAPLIARELRRHGAEVIAFVSEEALRYTTIDTLEWSTNNPIITRLTSKSEHLSDSSPFDAYLVAPATYNTINKFRYGIADNLLTTTLASAMGRMEAGKTKIIIAPTMHGSMHNQIFEESIIRLQEMGVDIIPPRDAYGKHNIPEENVIAIKTARIISKSPLKNKKILVTGGPTPVPVDKVRRITTLFTGKLGILIAQQLYVLGADVKLIHGESTIKPPEYLPHIIAHTYNEYKDLVLNTLEPANYSYGIFSAAVADYEPKEVFDGKIPSGKISAIELKNTTKIIKEVREKFPDLYMITFKFEQNISHQGLMEIAHKRINDGYQAVVANRGEEQGKGEEQVAYLVTRGNNEKRMFTKQVIAEEIAKHLEEQENSIYI